MTRILIMGAGNVGSALGTNWLAKGHDVRFGVPDPTDPKYAHLPNDRLQEATSRGDAEVVVLAVPYAAAIDALTGLGDLSGAVVIDCTNPAGMGPAGLELKIGHTISGAETIAHALPTVAVFKALNQTGAENMADSSGFAHSPMMMVAGDDEARKPMVMQLVGDLGFEAIDAGPLSAARLLEPLALLWIELAMKRGHGRDFAFAQLRRNDQQKPTA